MNLILILSLSIAFLSSATISSILGSSPPTSTLNASSITIQKPQINSMSTFKITDEIKDRINALLDSNRTNAAVEIGIVDRNGTQFYSTGKVSNTNNVTVDQNTVFAIGSNTKVFTAILLADMVEEGLIKLNDPIDKYLTPNVVVPQFK